MSFRVPKVENLWGRVWDSPTLTTWASLATRSAGLILVLPLLLRNLSPAELTVWYLLSSLAAFQTLADVGFSPTFTRILAYSMGGAVQLRDFSIRDQPAALGQPNFDLLARVNGTMHWIYNRLCLGLLLVLGGLGTLALLRPAGRLEHPEVGWLSWAVFLVATVASMKGHAYSAFLQGTNHVALARRWEAIFALASILTLFVVLLKHGNLLALALAAQSWVVLGVFRTAWLAGSVLDRRFRRAGRAVSDRDVLRYVWPAAWRSALATLMSQGLVQLSAAVAAQCKQSAVAAAYLVGLRIVQTINFFSQAPFYSKLPLFGSLMASGQSARLLLAAQRSMMLAYWCFVLPFIGASVLGPSLLKWIGSRTSWPSALVWTCLGLAFFIERYGAMHIQLVCLTNKIVTHVANGVSGVLTILAAWWLYPVFGLAAMPMGMAIGYAAFYAWYCASLSYRSFGFPFPKFEWQTAFLPAVLLAAFSLVFFWVAV